MADSCVFPGCTHNAAPNRATCLDHKNVTVATTGSWVPDRHDERSGGEH